MASLVFQLEIIAILTCSACALTVSEYFVKPSTEDNSCVGVDEPCHTLSYYSKVHNFTTGITFIFLPGNHSLSGETLTLANIDNVTLRGQSFVNIHSTSNITIFCEHTSNLKIEGLNFYIINNFATVVSSQFHISAISIINSQNVLLENNTFEGTANMVVITESDADIYNCTFQRNRGGALFAAYLTTLRILRCTFTNNEGTGDGGAVYAVSSEIILEENYFGNNTDPRHGAAVMCDQCELNMTQSNTFDSNVATHSKSEYLQGGGALYATRAKIKITGKAFLKNNVAHIEVVQFFCLSLAWK